MTSLIVHTDVPRNAEPPLARLRAGFATPQADFYVRSHGIVPLLTAAAHRLQVRGRVTEALDLSMADLRDNFPARTVMAVLQCAGNRRADLHRLRPVTGDPWSAGAIGNASWTGVSLAEVLHAAGAETGPDLHVAMDASDVVESDTVQAGEQDDRPRFGVSIPMAKALCPDVLLAFAMNGETLSPEHGFPLRAIVPGFAGVRSPKWLTSITVQDQPSDNAMQQSDYKLLPPDVTAGTVDWTQGVPINEMPLNAAICLPAVGATVPAGSVMVQGYAVCTGRTIQRVDVSTDGGLNWRQATLERRRDAPWSWTLWALSLDLPAGPHELVVRAWDSAGQTQPSSCADTWNFKGYLSAAWHRVTVNAV